MVNDINCRFEPGKFYAVVGPNGSGKTTFLDLVSGFLRPDAGMVLLGGHPVFSFSKRQIARRIALVSQHFQLNFPFRVSEVVMMGRHPYIDRFSPPGKRDLNQVTRSMADTGIAHLKNRHFTRLSGGEKQRCAFARALCQDTPILLLDEAFSNMDIHHTLQLLNRVKQKVSSADTLVIAVLHDINLAACFADEMVFIKRGAITAMGPISEVLTRTNIENVFHVPSKVEYNDYVQAQQVYFKIA